jgi:hypothetical protein
MPGIETVNASVPDLSGKLTVEVLIDPGRT